MWGVKLSSISTSNHLTWVLVSGLVFPSLVLGLEHLSVDKKCGSNFYLSTFETAKKIVSESLEEANMIQIWTFDLQTNRGAVL